MQIDIGGLDKAAVLAALVNSSQPLLLTGWMDPNSTRTMTVADAHEEMLTKVRSQSRLYFDYLWGRPIKVDLSGSSFDPSNYDRDNKRPAADVVNELRNR
ncbi:hypothetical protein [Actinomadura coerulea]|uniref:hypothetical protein n=1 Tax=Actinomadura coerulea TaxID=46159 RepID=UPI00341A252D